MLIVCIILCVFVFVILVRTIAFKPKDVKQENVKDVSFDEEAAVHTLSELIKCKTVSYYDSSLEDNAEFDKLIGLLPTLYPNVMKTLTLTRFPGRALLFHWKGKGDGDPAVFMAHYDVVPVNEELWDVPAFEAVIKDGAMWGRGTLDTKNTFNGVMSAGENLLKQGFIPENDIYFAFSGGEEINGEGAINIVNYFKEKGIRPSIVLDEGGAVVEGIFPGVSQPCGLIGIAEKGMLTLSFDVKSDGGHASAPAPHTPVGILSAACCKVENHPFKCHYTKPVREMFDVLGRRSTFLYRMIFANLWCFGWVLDILGKKNGGEINALIRTTVAFTQMKGSNAPNVVPPEASIVANLRLSPDDSIASAIDYIKNTIKDDRITLSKQDNMEPSGISRTDCKGWESVRNAVEQTWTGCVAAPYLMVQCSDSRHYGCISDKIYKFSAADMTKEEIHSIHGNNERIRIPTIKKCVEFYIRVMREF